jgi:hypothetical protein
MATLARHLLAIAVLPFTVVVLIPVWLSTRYDVGLRLLPTPLHVRFRESRPTNPKGRSQSYLLRISNAAITP